ncbi:thioredoxin family protein [Flavobacterium undicola]|uniref:thioredoxin family protein n=1 Tax=Flavobacterium undicola TaxID=1932779 RepID=UPI0013778215|nr:thioredoxin family protein [Flavobacterium undicola]MBA0883546.1 thioredoxin family protein [Flavobacterium undicola]
MKKIYLIAIFFIGLVATQAQELKWYTDVKEAVAVGNKQNKPLLLFFTGSDWCTWCMRLQKEVLTTPEFTKWAKEKVILVEVDDPRRIAQAPEIRQEYDQIRGVLGIVGYPTVYFVRGEKKDEKFNLHALGKTGYVAGGPVVWLEVANGILNQK